VSDGGEGEGEGAGGSRFVSFRWNACLRIHVFLLAALYFIQSGASDCQCISCSCVNQAALPMACAPQLHHMP
jgi:hypothetical protein